MDFVKIADPDKPGDYLVIAKRDFNPSTHTIFGAPAPDAAPAAPVQTDATAPAASAPTPAVSIADLTVAQALPVIEAADTLGELQLLQQQEAGRPSPRTGVLKALQTKIDAFSAQDE